MKKFDIVINKINFNSVTFIELLDFLQKIFPGINYKYIIKNNNEARNSVFWHILHSEKLLFDNTW